MAHSRFAKNTESGKAPQHPAAPRTQTETGDRGNGFDFIRYVLAFVVAVAHFYGLTDTPRQGWWMTSGDAVSGFFVLSGFLVFRSFLATLRRSFRKFKAFPLKKWAKTSRNRKFVVKIATCYIYF